MSKLLLTLLLLLSFSCSNYTETEIATSMENCRTLMKNIGVPEVSFSGTSNGLYCQFEKNGKNYSLDSYTVELIILNTELNMEKTYETK